MGTDHGSPRLRQVVLDGTDARALAEFYRRLLGFPYRPGDEPNPAAPPGADDRDWLVLRDPQGGAGVAFQQVDRLTPSTWPEDGIPQQLHLDLTVPTVAALDAHHGLVVSLGGRLLYDRSHDPEEPLRVYADPAGHPFCIFVAHPRPPLARRPGTPGWMIDELSHAGAENVNAEHVARYDAKEDAGAAAEVARCRSLGVDEHATVVDIGAGTGQFALAMAPWCRRVVAVEVSPVMRAELTAKIGHAGANNIEVVDAGFLTYEHAGPPADLVYSRYALHHLPDFWKGVALARMRGLLQLGGIVRLSDVVYSFDPAEAEARIEDWCATGTADPDSGWARSELEDHVRDEHSTYTWLLEPLLERAGFVIVDSAYSDDGIFADYVLRAASP